MPNKLKPQTASTAGVTPLSTAPATGVADHDKSIDGMQRSAPGSDNWFMQAVNAMLRLLNWLRQLVVQGMTASNSTHTPESQDQEPNRKS